MTDHQPLPPEDDEGAPVVDDDQPAAGVLDPDLDDAPEPNEPA